MTRPWAIFEVGFLDNGESANAERCVHRKISTSSFQSHHFRCVPASSSINRLKESPLGEYLVGVYDDAPDGITAALIVPRQRMFDILNQERTPVSTLVLLKDRHQQGAAIAFLTGSLIEAARAHSSSSHPSRRELL